MIKDKRTFWVFFILLFCIMASSIFEYLGYQMARSHGLLEKAKLTRIKKRLPSRSLFGWGYGLIGYNKNGARVFVSVNKKGADAHTNSLNFSYRELEWSNLIFRVPNNPSYHTSAMHITIILLSSVPVFAGFLSLIRKRKKHD